MAMQTLISEPDSIRKSVRALRVVHVGGFDLGLRIPMMNRMVDKGFEMIGIGSAEDAKFQAAGIPYHLYPLEHRFSVTSDRRATAKLAELLQKIEPDIVHGFHTKPAVIATMAAKRAKVPVCVRSITGMGRIFSSTSTKARLLRPVYSRIQKTASARASWTIFQNQDDQQHFLNRKLVAPERQSLVPGSGVEIKKLESQVPEHDALERLKKSLNLQGGPTVVMATRLVRYKGVQEYLDAARLVKQKMPQVNFLLMGGPSEDPRSSITVETVRKYSDAVTYLGLRSDVPAILACSDLLVHPTFYREGVPRILLEASVLRLPVVTTDLPGCRDVVVDGKNGRLVPPRNVEMIAAAIEETLSLSSVERQAMGHFGRECVENRFAAGLIADTYESLYHQLFLENH